jgi:hypothetical protein
MSHGRGIQIDLKCLGVTKPTTLCHVAWPGHKNRFKLFWGSPSPLPHVMLHSRGIKIYLKCFGHHQAKNWIICFGGHKAHCPMSCCIAGKKSELFVWGSPSPLPRVLLHGQGIQIDLKCSGVTKPTTPCHVAWPGHTNRFKMFGGHQAHYPRVMLHGRGIKMDLNVWGLPSPLPHDMLHSRGIKIDLKCFGHHQAKK